MGWPYMIAGVIIRGNSRLGKRVYLRRSGI
jgi:hypothetical protein